MHVVRKSFCKQQCTRHHESCDAAATSAYAAHVTSPDAVPWRGAVHFLNGCIITALILLVLLLQGKTLQAIAVMAAYRAEWPCLIVTPSSLRGAPLNYAHLQFHWLSCMVVQAAGVEWFTHLHTI